MANAFLNNQVFANVMLLLLKNQLVMGRLIDTQFKDQVNDENGLIINVKRPPRFNANDDSTLNASLASQDIVTGSVPIQVNRYAKVHIGVGDIEYVTSFNALMQNETMKSAASRLAHQVDSYLIGLTKQIPSVIQGAGSVSKPVAPANQDSTSSDAPLSSPVQAMAAYQRLLDQGAPTNGLAGVITPSDGLMLRGSLLSAYTPSINDDMLEQTRVPLVSSVQFHETQQCPTVTTGTRASTGASEVNGASQNVNYRNVAGSAGTAGMTQTLDIKGLTSGQTINAGEVFTIAGVNAWDWRGLKDAGYLQQFTVLSSVVADSSGDATITITPPIIVQGTNDGSGTDTNTAFGTVTAAPADSAAISWAGTASTAYRVRSAFHRQAFSMVTTRLITPYSGVASFAVDPDTGLALRYWRFSDGTSGKHYHRWDMMYGASVMDTYLATRVIGTALV